SETMRSTRARFMPLRSKNKRSVVMRSVMLSFLLGGGACRQHGVVSRIRPKRYMGTGLCVIKSRKCGWRPTVAKAITLAQSPPLARVTCRVLGWARRGFGERLTDGTDGKIWNDRRRAGNSYGAAGLGCRRIAPGLANRHAEGGDAGARTHRLAAWRTDRHHHADHPVRPRSVALRDRALQRAAQPDPVNAHA